MFHFGPRYAQHVDVQRVVNHAVECFHGQPRALVVHDTCNVAPSPRRLDLVPRPPPLRAALAIQRLVRGSLIHEHHIDVLEIATSARCVGALAPITAHGPAAGILGRVHTGGVTPWQRPRVMKPHVRGKGHAPRRRVSEQEAWPLVECGARVCGVQGGARLEVVRKCCPAVQIDEQASQQIVVVWGVPIGAALDSVVEEIKRAPVLGRGGRRRARRLWRRGPTPPRNAPAVSACAAGFERAPVARLAFGIRDSGPCRAPSLAPRGRRWGSWGRRERRWEPRQMRHRRRMRWWVRGMRRGRRWERRSPAELGVGSWE